MFTGRSKALSTLLTLVSLVLQLSPVNFSPAHAATGAEVQFNNGFVVAITLKQGKKALLCSGALIRPDMVATAKHCAVDKYGKKSTAIKVFSPGALFENPPIGSEEFRTVSKITVAPKESYILTADEGDVAFFKLKTAFKNTKLLPVATPEQLSSLIVHSKIYGYGYGAIGELKTKFSPQPRRFDLSWGNDDHAVVQNAVVIASASGIGCHGDSGGPVTAILADGSEVILGVAASVTNLDKNGCGTRSINQLYWENFNLIQPYLKLIN